MHPELKYFLSQLLNGLSMGSMYAMVAVGYSMVYSLLYLINFAHGDLYVFGTFVVFSLAMTNMPILAATVLGGLIAGLIGMTIERTMYRPIRGSNRTVPMISALGAAMVLRTLAQIIWGAEPLAFPSIIQNGFFRVGGFVIQYQQVLVLTVAAVFMVCSTLVMEKTKIGKATHCIMQNIPVSQLMGIPANTIIIVIYGLGGFVGVIGGVMFSSYYNLISINMGMWGTVKAWAAAMLGGVGSFYGAFFGGIILGVAESLAAAYINSTYKDAIGYVVIVLVLLLKPDGLFGKPKTEKV